MDVKKKISCRINNTKGSVLIWVMVALLVIALLTTIVLTISSRFYSSTRERSLDSQAYHTAYSLTRSIANWIVSYNPDLDTPEEREKGEFLEALKSGEPIIIESPASVEADMGTSIAEVTFTTDDSNPDEVLSRIDIVSTAEYANREVSVSATLESTNMRKADSMNVDFSINTADLRRLLGSNFVDVIGEISGAANTWPELAKQPAFMGRSATNWRYYSFYKGTPEVPGVSPAVPGVYENYTDPTTNAKITFMTVNPRFAGNRGRFQAPTAAGGSGYGTTATTNRYVYYSNASNDDSNLAGLETGGLLDFRTKSNSVLPNADLDKLDLRVYLNPMADMMDENIFDFGTDATAQPRRFFGTASFFGNTVAATNNPQPILKWPNQPQFDSTATLLEITGVGTNSLIPGQRFTYFTDPNFYDPLNDTSYILARYLGSGTSFAPTSTVFSPWSTYKSLYLYLLNESNEYFQITGAVASDGGAIFTRRDFQVGGTFDEKYIGTDSNWAHIGNYPTMLNDMQLYFASPSTRAGTPGYEDLRKVKNSVIQATPGARKSKNAAPTMKTRIDGGWIVIQNNHVLTITDALINTQKLGSSVKVNAVDTKLNGTSTESRTGGYTGKPQITTDLWVNPTSGASSTGERLAGKQSGNDIHVVRGGKLVLDKGALICSDIYVENGATLEFPSGSNAVLYGNIYSQGTVNINSNAIKIYGNSYGTSGVVVSNGDHAGERAGGLFSFEDGTLNMNITGLNETMLAAMFPNHIDMKSSIHSYMPIPADSPLAQYIGHMDETLENGICTHFDEITTGTAWFIKQFDGD